MAAAAVAAMNELPLKSIVLFEVADPGESKLSTSLTPLQDKMTYQVASIEVLLIFSNNQALIRPTE